MASSRSERPLQHSSSGPHNHRLRHAKARLRAVRVCVLALQYTPMQCTDLSGKRMPRGESMEPLLLSTPFTRFAGQCSDIAEAWRRADALSIRIVCRWRLCLNELSSLSGLEMRYP